MELFIPLVTLMLFLVLILFVLLLVSIFNPPPKKNKGIRNDLKRIKAKIMEDELY